MNCLRTGLDDKKLAGAHIDAVTILGPFNIHTLAVMIFNDAGPVGKLQNLIIIDNVGISFFRRGIDVPDRFFRIGIIVVDHLDLFGTDFFGNNRSLALFECRLEHVVFIGVDGTLDNVFTKSPGTGDKNRILKA